MTEGRQSVIVRFRQGDTLFIAPDLQERIREALQHLKCDGELTRLIRPISDGKGRGIHPDSSWFQLIKECMDRFAEPGDNCALRTEAAIRALAGMAYDSDPCVAWRVTKAAILRDIDLLSGWTDSNRRAICQRHSVCREDGKYCTVIDREVYETTGMKTETEERWDYTADACKGMYLGINGLLRIMALVAICLEYKARPEQFPASLSVWLPENNGNTGYLRWQWHLKWPYRPRPVPWRPSNNICDPNWLCADLLADFAGREQIPEADFDPPRREQLADRYEQEFTAFRRQLEFALDTPLRFGNGPEVWFKFRDLTLRWINSTDNMYTTLVIPVRNRSKDAGERQLAIRFLSCLAFQMNMPVTILSGVGIHKRFAPMLRHSIRSGGILHSDEFVFQEFLNVSDKAWRAYAYYREGLGSSSTYYAFLNFYKVIQLAFGEKVPKITEWVNANLQNVPNLSEVVQDIRRQHKDEDVVKYLWESCRCAIAHTSRDVVVDPDNPDDRTRVARALPLVQRLAAHAINSGLFGKTGQDIKHNRVIS